MKHGDDPYTFLQQAGLTIPPSRGGSGSRGGCMFLSRWEGDTFRFAFPNTTINALLCDSDEFTRNWQREWQRAVRGSERLKYLKRLRAYADKRHGCSGAVGPIESNATTAAGVADDAVAWLCDKLSLALRADSIPTELRERAEVGKILPPGFSPSALVPPDPTPYIETMDQTRAVWDWNAWQNRWMLFILPIVENTSATGAVDMHCIIRPQLRRIRAESLTAADPDALVAEKLRSLSDGKADALPKPPVMESTFAPTKAPLSENLSGEAAQAVEDVMQDREEAEEAEARSALQEETEQGSFTERLKEKLLRERKPGWREDLLRYLNLETAADIEAFYSGLKDGMALAGIEEFIGLADLSFNLGLWYAYEKVLPLPIFKKGHETIENMLSALKELVGDFAKDPSGEMGKLAAELVREVESAKAQWKDGKPYESGMTMGELLWDVISLLTAAYGVVKGVAFLVRKLSPRVARLVEKIKAAKPKQPGREPHTVPPPGPKVKHIKTLPAEEVNKLSPPKGDWEVPFLEGTRVRLVELMEDMVFVRFKTATNKKTGGFLARAKDVEGMTPEQIYKHLNLDSIPTHVQQVKVPAGTRLYHGRIGPQTKLGHPDSGGWQFQLASELTRKYFGDWEELHGVFRNRQ